MDILFIFVVFLCVFDNSDSQGAQSITKRRSLKHKSTLQESKFPDELTLPIMIHFDHQLASEIIKKYKNQSRKKIKIISKDILGQVTDLFSQPSLNQKVTFNLVDARMLKNNSNGKFMDASKYLESYCAWQAEKKKREQRLYFSILLTGVNLYTVDGKKRDLGSKARGYMYGICTNHKSCTLLEYNPLHIGHTLAHEIAHSLGVSHDGPPNSCVSKGHIMNALYSPNEQPRFWTPCNKRDLKHFLTSKKAWCLRNQNVSSPGKQDKRT